MYKDVLEQFNPVILETIWFGIQFADRLRLLLDVAEQSNTA